jgi:heme o synthase
MNMSKSQMPFNATLQRYYQLSKPGIIYANVLTALAGYLFASQFDIDLMVLLGLLGGLALLIAGACAANNYLDRGIDARMQRTQKRAVVTGKISATSALIYATATALLGVLLLSKTQNTVTVVLALIAYVDYVILYGYTKRTTRHSTLVGTISGSIPLVAGYTAVAGRLDVVALFLFLLMAAWQMAHFYAIALYRKADYAAASIPVVSVVRSAEFTKAKIRDYELLFIAAALALLLSSDIGYIAGTLLMLLGAAWVYRTVSLPKTTKPEVWGKKVFLFSLSVMLGMVALLAVGPLLV